MKAVLAVLALLLGVAFGNVDQNPYGALRMQDSWKQEITYDWDELDHAAAFESWKQEFNKEYTDLETEAEAFITFLDNWRRSMMKRTPVKNQGQCGSCWAITSTTPAIFTQDSGRCCVCPTTTCADHTAQSNAQCNIILNQKNNKRRLYTAANPAKVEEMIGGTDFEVGYNGAIDLYSELNKDEFNDNNYFNRIIFLTDAQPNIGNTNPNSLLSLFANTNNKLNNYIYTTFIDVGLDFNSKLIETISSTRGCNYYSVKSAKDFMIRVDEEFEYMVSPLVFDVNLKLNVEGNSCQVDNVYGCSYEKLNKILENGEIRRINTLFPAKKSSKKGVSKGGIQLITVAEGPVSIAIEADQSAFQFYSGDVLTGTCGTRLDHGVLAVGYGTSGSKNEWDQLEGLTGSGGGEGDNFIGPKLPHEYGGGSGGGHMPGANISDEKQRVVRK